jgi:hypothetical protein
MRARAHCSGDTSEPSTPKRLLTILSVLLVRCRSKVLTTIVKAVAILVIDDAARSRHKDESMHVDGSALPARTRLTLLASASVGLAGVDDQRPSVWRNKGQVSIVDDGLPLVLQKLNEGH